ncbi:MAG: DUF2318 domain-containing protein [Eubacteriales bacterium]
MNKRSLNKIFLIVLIVGIIFGIAACTQNKDITNLEQKAFVKVAGEELTINTVNIDDEAKFFSYDAYETEVTIFAIKASDGSIRTALDTCQICYDSGRGYYIQEGEELICHNCGNRFQIDQIGVLKDGCNPIPILAEDKVENSDTITIDKGYIKDSTRYFGY